MSLLNKYFLVFTVSILCAVQGFAQADTDSIPSANKGNSSPLGALHRPSIALGIGALNYYGDVGNLNGISQSYQLNWGYNLQIINPISNSFGLNLFALFGKIRANERLLNDDVNFETKIKMGGLSVTYNFDAFLPEKRNVTPYISLGFSTYEYDTKSDMLDAQGNPYHYWDDGTVRLLAQSNPSASEDTPLLVRDYNYETDLRKNSDQGQAYNTRGFTIPIGAGAELKMTDAFTLRMGAEFHIGLTDNLDNISDDSQYGGGKKGNDHLLYTNLGIAYNLHKIDKKETPGLEIPGDAVLLKSEDQDQDGVADIYDVCPNTPEGVAVSEYGCPWDTDGDHVPDYMDLEPKSAKGAIVNLEGVTVSEEEAIAMYETYMSGSGEMNFNRSTTSTADIQRNQVNMKSRVKGYRVVISQSTDLGNEDFAKLLSVKDLKAEEDENGSTYYLGYYKTLEEAMQNRPFLSDFDTKIEFNEFGNISELAEYEIEHIHGDYEPLYSNPNQVVFRVQIGAYRYRLSKNVFTDVPELLVLEGTDGLTRYVAGSFSTIQDAAHYKVDLLLKGFEGAFVTAYRGGKRITLKEAGATVNSKEDITGNKESGKINKDLVKFTVQLDSFEGRVPAAVLGKFMNLGGVRPLRGDNGKTNYVFGTFQTLEDAEQALKELNDQGFDKAQVVGNFNGQIIDKEEATRIKNI